MSTNGNLPAAVREVIGMLTGASANFDGGLLGGLLAASYADGLQKALDACDPCFLKVGPDEPIFVLRAQDAFAADLVEKWANWVDRAYEDLPEPVFQKLHEAFGLAVAMRAWPTHKVPD